MQSPVGVQGAKPPWAGAGRSARKPNPLRQEIRAGRSARKHSPRQRKVGCATDGADSGAQRPQSKIPNFKYNSL
jgi:hypothetical protein